MKLNTIQQARITNKRILLRCELNTPLKNGRITDDNRIKKALPTIRYILKNKPKQIIIMAHLGRPKGEPNKKFSLKPVAKRLEKLLKRKVEFYQDDIKATKELPKSKIILLENIRFYKEEKKNSKVFASKLAKHADLYINDAFGVCHRKHASVHAITEKLKSYAGLLIEEEVKQLEQLNNPKRPFIAIIGGGKADKLTLVKKLLKKADMVLVAGTAGNMLIKAEGNNIGKTPYDPKLLKLAKQVLTSNKAVQPIDVVIANKPGAKQNKTVDISNIPNSKMVVDLGSNSLKEFNHYIKQAKTIFWGGPVGYIEFKEQRKGSIKLAKLIANSKANTILGGGDTALAAKQAKQENKFNHISTGGGASLDFLENQTLPGLKVLEKKRK